MTQHDTSSVRRGHKVALTVFGVRSAGRGPPTLGVCSSCSGVRSSRTASSAGGGVAPVSAIQSTRVTHRDLPVLRPKRISELHLPVESLPAGVLTAAVAIANACPPPALVFMPL